jgi:hypothetical protein
LVISNAFWRKWFGFANVFAISDRSWCERCGVAPKGTHTGGTMSIKSTLTKFMDHSVIKAIFSISIIGSALPSIYHDVTTGQGLTWAYFGNVMIGILMLLESWLWTADVVREQ